MNPLLDVESFQISPRHRVIGTGLIALDILLCEDKSPLSSALGGSAGNVLAILAHLGWSSVPVGQVGIDSAATHIRSEFEELYADTRFLVGESQMCTPIVFQMPSVENGTHQFSFSCPHCGRKHQYASSSNTELRTTVLGKFEHSNVYFFDRVTPLSIGLAEEYRRRGALIIFEPSSIGQRDVDFERAVRAAHIIKYANDRIESLQMFDLSNVAVEIRTLGKDGLEFRSPSSKNMWETLHSFPTEFIADTAGAGDWCTAGMLYSLFRDSRNPSVEKLINADVKEALRFGQALATLNCQYDGARGMARCNTAQQIFEMASTLRNKSSTRSTLGRHQAKRPESNAYNHFSKKMFRNESALAKLCCDGLSL